MFFSIKKFFIVPVVLCWTILNIVAINSGMLSHIFFMNGSHIIPSDSNCDTIQIFYIVGILHIVIAFGCIFPPYLFQYSTMRFSKTYMFIPFKTPLHTDIQNCSRPGTTFYFCNYYEFIKYEYKNKFFYIQSRIFFSQCIFMEDNVNFLYSHR